MILKVSTKFCKYDVVKACLNNVAFEETDQDDWNLMWIDTGVSLDRVIRLKTHQIINHFPGMNEICRKDFLARNVSKIRKVAADEYEFFPKTWVLPNDLTELEFYTKLKRNMTFIAKPDNGCQGAGIFLFKTMDQFLAHRTSYKTKYVDSFFKNDCVVQEYKDTPLLLDGYKFDLRIYVLIKSFDPLQIHIYKKGIVRLATLPYESPSEKNTSEQCMHLTNYAITKDSKEFEIDDKGETGSKRSLESLWSTLKEQKIDTDKIWKNIGENIVKTILLIQPDVKNVMRTIENKNQLESKCFEILGFDIMLDRDLIPWVIEVNHSPSFKCDTALDLDIKNKLISDTLILLQPDFEKLGQTNRMRDKVLTTDYQLIYPSPCSNLQDKFDRCLAKVFDTSRGNKAEMERRKHIKNKIELAENKKTLFQQWKIRHGEKNVVLASIHASRSQGRQPNKIILPRAEKHFVGKTAFKLSVTDLYFDL